VTRLARIALGPVGLEHVRTRLRPFERIDLEHYPGGYPLRATLSRIVRADGDVWTWAPPGWQPTLQDVRDESLPARISQRHHRDLLFAFILGYLKTPNHVMLIEDHDARSTDRPLRELPQWVAYGKHVYWYATDEDRTVLWKVLNWGIGLYTCMVLAGGEGLWTPGRRLTERRIERLAKSADHVVVDAFDFEGSVVWSRRRAGLRLSRGAAC
jgi:hypothetical protein